LSSAGSIGWRRARSKDTVCAFTERWARKVDHYPIITPNGPVFTKRMRYRCSTHSGTTIAGGGDSGDVEDTKGHNTGQGEALLGVGPFDVYPHYYRLGDMRYSPDMLITMQNTYVDLLTIAGVKNTIHNIWLGNATKALTVL
jgi:hypothetical protein